MAEAANQEVETEGVRGFPATVRANGAFGDEASLLTLLKNKAFDASVFEESPPFFWTAEISNNSIDAYFSRMMPSSLKNYAAEAENGVAFQNSHNCRELSLGRSLSGRFVGGQGNGASRVEAAFYTIPDLQLGQLSTNEFIRGVRASIVNDVSIGFYGGRSVCSICKGDIWDWMSGTCIHWPGEEYDILNDSGKATGREMAIEQIEDAHLAEVSGVYDGATFGAEIFKKAIAQIETGNLKPETARVLESRYRMRLPGKRVQLTGFKEEGDREVTIEKPTTETERTNEADIHVVVLASEGRSIDLNFGSNQSLADQVQEVLTARDAEILTLRAGAASEEVRRLADDGRTYRTDLVNETLGEGVRAHGNTFPQETYRGMFEKASIEDIKKARDAFKVSADDKFKGGRQTVDEPVTPPSTIQLTPDAAFTA